MNNAIRDFYLDIPTNGMPTCAEVLNSDYHFIEGTHNWCQRAFPNYEPSEIVADAPVLDDDTLAWIKQTQMEKVYLLVFRYLYHYTDIYMSGSMAHNNRRVTRLLKFLRMLECPDYIIGTVYDTCYDALFKMTTDFNNVKLTLAFWNEALGYKRENNNEPT